MVKEAVPDAGDILWINLNPTKGHEQSGTRPVIVASFASFNRLSGLCTIIPMTHVQKGYINEVVINAKDAHGVALIDQVRTLDFKNRRCTLRGKVSEDELAEIRAKLATLLGILE